MRSKSGSIDVAKSHVLFADTRHAANSASLHNNDNISRNNNDNDNPRDDDNDDDPGKLQLRHQSCRGFGDCAGSVYDDQCKQLLLGTFAWI